jgi:hypothetical protein
MAMKARWMPIPILIFALLDSALVLGVGVVVGEFVDEDICEEVVDFDGTSVALANAAKSELCHHTGIPKPYIL